MADFKEKISPVMLGALAGEPHRAWDGFATDAFARQYAPGTTTAPAIAASVSWTVPGVPFGHRERASGLDGRSPVAEDARTYVVVVNDEEQYSIWPDDREPPAGWRTVGRQGPKSACLDYIAEVWTDMRPLTLRRQMDSSGDPVAGVSGTCAPAGRCGTSRDSM